MHPSLVPPSFPPASPRRRRPRCQARLAARAGLRSLRVAAALAVGLVGLTSLAAAGDSPDAPPAPTSPAGLGTPAEKGSPAPTGMVAVSTPRAVAVEAEIRALERVLATLRRARADLKAGRSEPAPLDEATRRARDADLRALRELVRYEGARSKALASLDKAVEAKDDAQLAAGRATLETLDGSFVAALARVESGGKPAADGDARPAPQGDAQKTAAPKAGAPKAGDPKAGDPKAGAAPGEEGSQKGDRPPAKPRAGTRGAPGAAGDGRPARPAGEGTMSGEDPDGDLGEDAADDLLDPAGDLGD